jgi:hypothetical protein
MALQDEILEKSAQIKTDSYPMSIGEMLNLYRDKELDIHPEFQRVFRWTDYQKTRLIESLDDRWLDVLLREHIVALRRHVERKKTENDATTKELVDVMIGEIEEVMRRHQVESN